MTKDFNFKPKLTVDQHMDYSNSEHKQHNIRTYTLRLVTVVTRWTCEMIITVALISEYTSCTWTPNKAKNLASLLFFTTYSHNCRRADLLGATIAAVVLQYIWNYVELNDRTRAFATAV